MHDNHDPRRSEALLESLMMLAFGIGILAFLVAIDRPQWFNLRPASGIASAMAKASHADAARRERMDAEANNASDRWF